MSTTQNKTAGLLLEVTSDDVDNDGIKNDVDNCPETANPNQSDLDGDGINEFVSVDENGEVLTVYDFDEDGNPFSVLLEDWDCTVDV